VSYGDLEWPDAEQVMCDLLADLGHTCTSVPVGEDGKFDLSKLPILLINRVGGGNDGFNDRPVIDVEVFSHTRRESMQISGQVRRRVLNSAGTAPGGVLIDHAREVTGIKRVPDIDPQNRAVLASYGLTFRPL